MTVEDAISVAASVLSGDRATSCTTLGTWTWRDTRARELLWDVEV